MCHGARRCFLRSSGRREGGSPPALGAVVGDDDDAARSATSRRGCRVQRGEPACVRVRAPQQRRHRDRRSFVVARGHYCCSRSLLLFVFVVVLGRVVVRVVVARVVVVLAFVVEVEVEVEVEVVVVVEVVPRLGCSGARGGCVGGWVRGVGGGAGAVQGGRGRGQGPPSRPTAGGGVGREGRAFSGAGRGVLGEEQAGGSPRLDVRGGSRGGGRGVATSARPRRVAQRAAVLSARGSPARCGVPGRVPSCAPARAVPGESLGAWSDPVQ